MKFIVIAAIVLTTIFVSVGGDVDAHPGGTDGSGGHTCRTDCSSWGLAYGEYHYHSGNYVEPDYFEQGGEAGLEYMDENSDFITSSAVSAAAKKGALDGEAGDPESPDNDADDICTDVDFASSSGPQDFYDGFMDTYTDACRDLYDEHYSDAYETAYLAGIEKYQSEREPAQDLGMSTYGSDKSAGSWTGLLWLGIIAVPYAIYAVWAGILYWLHSK